MRTNDINLEDEIRSIIDNLNYHLFITSYSSEDDIPKKGKNLIIVAKSDISYYIRIFNYNGDRIINREDNKSVTSEEIKTAINEILDLQEKISDSQTSNKIINVRRLDKLYRIKDELQKNLIPLLNYEQIYLQQINCKEDCISCLHQQLSRRKSDIIPSSIETIIKEHYCWGRSDENFPHCKRFNDNYDGFLRTFIPNFRSNRKCLYRRI